VAVDAQGAAYVVGDFSSPSVTIGSRKLVNAGTRGSDIFLAKVARGGQVEWAFSWGGEDEDTAAAIVLDPKGEGFYVAGSFRSATFALDDQNAIVRAEAGDDFDSFDEWTDDYSSSSSSWDDDGSFSWEDDGSSSTASSTTGGSGLLSGLGGGAAAADDTGDFDCFVAKVSPRGEVLWVQAVGERDGNDFAVALAASTEAVYLAGMFESTLAPVGDGSFVVNSADEGAGTTDVFWSAFAAESGEVQGATSYANVGQDLATDLVVDTGASPEDYPALLFSGSYAGGDLYVVGVTAQNEDILLPAPAAGKTAAFLVKNGGMGPENPDIAWAKDFGADSSIARLALDVPVGAIYAAGSFPTLAAGGAIPTLVRLSLATGDVVWTRVLPRPAEVAVDFLGFVYASGCVG
jgi:hypothetical protein